MELAWWIGGFALLAVAVWFGAVAVFFGDDDSVAALVVALILATPLTVQFLWGNDDSLWGILVLPFGAVLGGLVLHSWWWPVLCPLPALVVATWWVWSDYSRPPRNPELDPMPEIRMGMVEVLVFAGESLVAALWVAGVAAMGVALGRERWLPALILLVVLLVLFFRSFWLLDLVYSAVFGLDETGCSH